MLLTIFFKSRSGVSNKEKSAELADLFLCMWSSLAALHHVHFDSFAFFPPEKCIHSNIFFFGGDLSKNIITTKILLKTLNIHCVMVK